MIERNADIGGTSTPWLFTGWRGGMLRAWAFVAAALAIMSAGDDLRSVGVFGPGSDGTLGYEARSVVGRPGWQQLMSVATGGPAATFGMRAGSLIHFDHPFLARARMVAGNKVGLTIVAATGAGRPIGTPTHATLIAQPRIFATLPIADKADLITAVLSQWLAITLAVLALVRGWGGITALALGFGLLSFAHGLIGPAWATTPGLAAAVFGAGAMVVFGGLGLLALPVALYIERVGPLPLAWRVIYAGIAAFWVSNCILVAWCRFANAAYPIVGNGGLVFYVELLVLNLPALYWAWRGARGAIGADKNRFATLAAVTLFQIFNGTVGLISRLSGTNLIAELGIGFQIVLTLAIYLLIPLTLAYAVLRHRVIDPGFVINRTVVFGTISAMLLASVGLIEWGVEHLLPESWVRASAWIDAAAAVAVYLGFHRIHGAVETRIEHMVFQSWQANAGILRRFVESAPHFEDERALAQSFADELARFCDEGNVALYRRRERTLDAILERTAGSWDAAPRTLPVDDPAFALMRAERAPIDLTETLTDLPGVLALPMLDHGTMAGLVLMDLKSDGALYRPDEIALLGWAAHEVALALAALHAGVIAAENRLLKAQLARLSSLIGQRLETNGA